MESAPIRPAMLRNRRRGSLTFSSAEDSVYYSSVSFPSRLHPPTPLFAPSVHTVPRSPVPSRGCSAPVRASTGIAGIGQLHPPDTRHVTTQARFEKRPICRNPAIDLPGQLWHHVRPPRRDAGLQVSVTLEVYGRGNAHTSSRTACRHRGQHPGVPPPQQRRSRKQEEPCQYGFSHSPSP